MRVTRISLQASLVSAIPANFQIPLRGTLERLGISLPSRDTSPADILLEPLVIVRRPAH